ncbi:MAG: hypothetical protein K2J78_08845, partial [Muribaculaceae bacterium]|nr:hypothetical protein [Muribaculaceae bacterium]
LQERIDDTTFRNVYVDKEGKGLFEIIIRYTTNEKPYYVKFTTKLNPIPEMRVFTQKDLDLYNELVSKLK